MAIIICFVVLATIISCTESNPVPASALVGYQHDRSELIFSEQCMRIGADIVLNGQETVLNQFIMKEKRKLMEQTRINRTDYIPAVSFFLSKSWIETTSIFKIIREMPKGASLHLHDLAMTNLDWLIQNATYRDNVYMCVDKDQFIVLSVFQTPPNDTECSWRLVETARNQSGNATEFDESLKRNISLLTTDPLQTYPSVDLVWDRFNKYFAQVGVELAVKYNSYNKFLATGGTQMVRARNVAGLITYAPVMKDYFREALEQFRADNVQYLEMRGQIAGLNELNGTKLDGHFGVNLYKGVVEEFVRDHPDFSGAKIIMSSLRVKDKTEILDDVKVAMDLYSSYPNFFLGYDLVGQEDPNHPLLYYIDELLYPSQQNKSRHLPFFFHAAETNWQGTEVDYNLVDALLLNTTRIGHGYGLVKHPKLVELVKAKGVAVEVNPISNQLLGLVSDLRNHAMAPLIAQNIPLVLSSDDPGTWEALPLSHDFYTAFMDLTGEDADLTVLKQLAMNSLQYSAMNSSEKTTALKLWETKWDTFVNSTIVKWNLVADNTTAVDGGKARCQKPTTEITTQANIITTTPNNLGAAPSPMLISLVIPLLINTLVYFSLL